MIVEDQNFFFANTIKDIQKESWNDCVGLDHPFTRYEFLEALEKSKSAINSTGWKPFHYFQVNNKKEIVAICPLYIKSHSFGEYIFDHSWAEAYEKYGLKYYPKLQSAVPFTPVTGERIIINRNKLSYNFQYKEPSSVRFNNFLDISSLLNKGISLNR